MGVEIQVDIETYEKLKDKNTKIIVFKTDGKPSVFVNLTNKKEDK